MLVAGCVKIGEFHLMELSKGMLLWPMDIVGLLSVSWISEHKSAAIILLNALIMWIELSECCYWEFQTVWGIFLQVW